MISYSFSGFTDTWDIVSVSLSNSWASLFSNYISPWWESWINFMFNTSGLNQWNVFLSGSVFSLSGNYILGSRANGIEFKDTLAPLTNLVYSTTWMTTSPVVATITLLESWTITNNGGSNQHVFSWNGSFVFYFKDIYWNSWSRTAVISNFYYVTLGGWITYIPYDYSSTNTVIDACPNGDYSSSNHDWICFYWVPATNYPIKVIKNRVIYIPTTEPRVGSIKNSKYSDEMDQAFLFAFRNGSTTISNIEEANLDWNVTRAQLSKIISKYASTIGKQADNNAMWCSFLDINDQDPELQVTIEFACRLHIMWNGLTYFNPNGTVSRWEFGTILSRLLYGSLYEWWNPYYENHLKNLKNSDIISSTNPSLKETRWSIILMIYRSAQQ